VSLLAPVTDVLMREVVPAFRLSGHLIEVKLVNPLPRRDLCPEDGEFELD